MITTDIEDDKLVERMRSGDEAAREKLKEL